MNRSRLVLVITVSLIAILGAAYLVWIGSGGPDGDDVITAPPVDMSMQGVELTRSSGDGSRWTLKAEGAEYQQEDGVVSVRSPRIEWERADHDSVTVTSASGTVDQSSGNAQLWPDVVIVSGDTTVHAGRLEYSEQKRSIHLREDVRIVRGGLALDAPEVVFDLDTNVITATGGVRAELTGHAEPTMEDKP
ncbi:LPS export ABC transporter protein LptC [Desulfobaculum xiamenense]|uniref:LPS export ABC transporter protein LptC n=1 Tax=Desulfobaculum xiamenense TaxID=995050 RepID=A0A846QHX1_9BACT|nr:LPS export ABC transporter periplasmic protein LptC [Desulfobaculum xiamenense]NJB66710.1 LPS export ABC transporter protein LptC [Desulfobaculum xiamenense]